MDISKLLNENLIILNLKSKNKLEAIKEMIEVLDNEKKLLDKDIYTKAVLEREEQFSTGIGMGVAIPHGKSKGVKEAALVFAKSKEGIDFSSMDGKPVHLFFLIAVPEEASDEHLRILSSLSRRLMHEELRKKLKLADTPSQIIEILKAVS